MQNKNINLENIKNSIVTVSDFPIKGISFKDITPLFLDPKKIEFIIDEMKKICSKLDFDIVVSPESRGFLFGIPLALKIEKPFVFIRKKGKLARPTESIDYELEYGKSTLEVIKQDVKPGNRVLIVDDLIATGGTSIAIQTLLKKLNAKVVGQIFLVELTSLLKDKSKLDGDFFSLIKY